MQIIGQAKFTYSPLRKAFEKQMKTIKDQEEKQGKPIQWIPLISKQKEKFNKHVDERLDEINKLDEKVSSDDLIYKYKGPTVDLKFNEFDYALDLIDKIKGGKIKLADAKNDQIKFKSDLGEIKKWNKKIDQKSKKTLCIILKRFTKQEKMLLNFMMIILQWYLKQGMKQPKEQKLKY